MPRWTSLILLLCISSVACQTIQRPRNRPPRQERPPRGERPPRQDRPNRGGQRGEKLTTPYENPEAVPLTDMVEMDATYKGYEGGLYFGSNEMPAEYFAFGLESAKEVQPLDTQGNPSEDGAIVLMNISMSNAVMEWCHPSSRGAEQQPPNCASHTFMGRAASDPTINDEVSIILGAHGGKALDEWDSATDYQYDRVENDVLAVYGLTEDQVQIIWIKTALRNEPSRPSLPDADASAFLLEETLGDVFRALQTRYPNLKQIFLTSRIFGGWAASDRNSPEPWAYETGFGTKWAIEARIDQYDNGQVDEETGDLSGVPFAAWGPYLWSYGDKPREDGLVWTSERLSRDGIHPSSAGEAIVADYLMDFFKTSPLTSCWFLEGLSC